MTSTYPIGTIGSVASLLAETHQEILIGTTSFRILDQWRDERYWRGVLDVTLTSTIDIVYSLQPYVIKPLTSGIRCILTRISIFPLQTFHVYVATFLEVKVTLITPHQWRKSRLHWLHLINGGSQGYIDYTSSMEGVKVTLITPHQWRKSRLHWLHWWSVINVTLTRSIDEV
jgi:hypothetical protein